MTGRVLAIFFAVFACCSLGAQSGSSASNIDGAGSNTINPLFQAWAKEYAGLHPGVRISYTSIGSNGGFRALASGQAFFGVTDVPISDDQLAQAKGRILQLPIVVNAAVPVYNLPVVPPLRFSGSTLAGIFLGKITKWNDPAIASDNPGVDLPAMDIQVRHAFPNGGAETQVMAGYLSNVSPAFKAAIANSSANWPLASHSYKGATGTPGFVSKTPDSFGYLPFVIAQAFSREDSLKYAAVKNLDGEFVTASPESITAASASAKIEPSDFRVSLTNAPGKASYPIASFIWLLMYENPKDKKQNEAMTGFLKWV